MFYDHYYNINFSSDFKNKLKQFCEPLKVSQALVTLPTEPNR